MTFWMDYNLTFAHMAVNMTKNKVSEIWKEVPGYSAVMASSHGRIKFKATEHITEGGVAGAYRRVSVVVNQRTGERRLVYVHDLVCRAFHGKPQKGQVVLHGDDDKLNCEPDNLKWGYQSENIKSAHENGLIKRK